MSRPARPRAGDGVPAIMAEVGAPAWAKLVRPTTSQPARRKAGNGAPAQTAVPAIAIQPRECAL